MTRRAPRGGRRCTADGTSARLRYRFWWATEPAEWLDNLIHNPRMAWIPRPLTSWVCDLMDWKLGLSWSEIRQARHGNLRGYTNQLDWRAWASGFNANSTSSTLGEGVVDHYNSGERA